jgi:hypothetical protein
MFEQEAWPAAPTRRINAISVASVDTSLVIAASAPGAALEGPAGQGSGGSISYWVCYNKYKVALSYVSMG